jgi:hypothetical protein
MVEVHQDDGHRLEILSAGAANASLHSAVLRMVGVLDSQHVAGKAKEDFAWTVSPVLVQSGQSTAMLSFGKASIPAAIRRRQPLQSTI